MKWQVKKRRSFRLNKRMEKKEVNLLASSVLANWFFFCSLFYLALKKRIFWVTALNFWCLWVKTCSYLFNFKSSPMLSHLIWKLVLRLFGKCLQTLISWLKNRWNCLKPQRSFLRNQTFHFYLIKSEDVKWVGRLINSFRTPQLL